MNPIVAKAFHNLFDAFPRIKEGINNADNPAATTAVWFTVVDDCSPDDVVRVVGMIISGDMLIPAAYDRDQLPQMIRREANRLRSERVDREESDRKQEMGRKHQTDDAVTFGAILHRAMHCEPDEVPALIAESRKLELEEPRYYCNTCRDTGLVPVWSEETTNDLLNCVQSPRRKVVCAACTCFRAKGVREGSDRWRPLVVYNEQSFCLAYDEDLEALRTWLNRG